VPPRASSGAGVVGLIGASSEAAGDRQGWGSFSVSSAAAQLAASAALQAAQQGRLRQQSQVVESTASLVSETRTAAVEGPMRRSVSAKDAPNAAAAGSEAAQQVRPRQSQVAVFGLPGLAQHVGHQMGIPGRSSQGPAVD
jgi:hypothetical protein